MFWDKKRSIWIKYPCWTPLETHKNLNFRMLSLGYRLSAMSLECCRWATAGLPLERWRCWSVKMGYLNMGLTIFGAFFSSYISFFALRDWERPLEAIWGVGKLSYSSLGLQASSMVICPFWGWGRRWVKNWRWRWRRGGAHGAWSGCQGPWERLCIFSLVPISSLSLQFCEP